MKKILLLATLLSMNTNSALINDGDMLFTFCDFTENYQDPGEEDMGLLMEGVCSTALTTTSLPTVLIDDVNIQDQALQSSILTKESQGTESMVTSQIAKQLGTSIADVKNAVTDLIEQGVSPDIKNVTEYLE